MAGQLQGKVAIVTGASSGMVGSGDCGVFEFHQRCHASAMGEEKENLPCCKISQLLIQAINLIS